MSSIPLATKRSRRPSSAVFARISGTSTSAVYAVALVALIAHLLVAQNYGYFRDELYYIAAGRHLSLGYVDFPLLTAALAALLERTIGLSLFALHLIPALAHAALVVATGLIARRLGGGPFAQYLAALASLASVSFLATGSIFSMDSLDALWWSLGFFVLVALIQTGNRRFWLLFGLVAGIGLLTKLTILFFGFAVVAALLLTSERVLLRSRWLLVGGVVAAIGLAPYVVWNATHGWATLGFWANYSGKLVHGSAISFLVQQILTANPANLPLWIAGLTFYFSPVGKRYRALGWAFVILFVLFGVTQAKAYFLSPAYPVLFAAGAVRLEAWTRSARRWLRPTYAGVLVLTGLILAPVAMPILPPTTFGQVYGFMGGDAGVQMERHQTAVLPQWLADRFGWDNLVARVAQVHATLPANERARACIVTENYGEAGAIDFFGPRYGLPHAISGHNTYWIWGPDDCSGEVVISVGVSKSDLSPQFANVQRAATVTCDFCMPQEDDLPIYVNRQPKLPLDAAWQRARHFE